MTNRPYTCDQLAVRWHCSAETVRQMIKRGELHAFKVGRMFRVPAVEVERHENCANTPSDGSMADLLSPGMKRTVEDDVIVLRHAPERKRKQKPAMSSFVN